MAMILDLFDYSPEWVSNVESSKEDTMLTNPCTKCPLNGLCDSDECGAHSYPLDVPTTRFNNLGEYIRFIKHYDWL